MTSVLMSFQPPGRRRFDSWGRREPVLAGLDPDALRACLLDTSVAVDFDRRDELLAALIRLSRDDQGAGTFLIACLLPGLRRKIEQHGWGLERDEAVSLALLALWRRIRSYPLHRRPRRIAMNLLMDTGHDLIDARRRELRWRQNIDLTGRAIPAPDYPTPDDVTPDSFWLAAHRSGVLNQRELTLIYSTRVDGLPIAHIAPLIGMSHDAARKARQRAVHKLRAWWTTLQQVA